MYDIRICLLMKHFAHWSHMNEQMNNVSDGCYCTRGFYRHLAIYAVGVGAMVSVNLLACRDYLWFVWPVLGWGVGLFFHGISVFRWCK
ncbi:hypothetical protein CSA37_03905 [Candidatus Fermentibacteria bacterium]|nr:MAG: hypothetical protein CSA37_03905 [Candidatus Fermentibacteria bacterium]